VERPSISVTLMSTEPLSRAENRSITADALRGQLDRLGNTPYRIESVTSDLEGSPFIPVSLLNQMRREAVEKLQQAQELPPTAIVRNGHAVLERSRARVRPAPADTVSCGPALHVLVRTPEQLDAALALCPASITLDYLDLYGLRPSVERVKSAGIPVRVASPRVLKPGEARISNFLLSLDCAVLVRSTAVLDALRGKTTQPLIGDFSLNTANSLTADTYLQVGLARLTPTHDLNAAQISALARELGGASIEAVAYQHLPVFHTEHCVFCRFLSTGTSYRDCGRPCEQHRVALRDKSGRAHPVMADVGCRNTVFGAEAQEASTHLAEWLRAGIRDFRLEFVHESAAQVRRVFRAFESALKGETTTEDLACTLRAVAPEGITLGSLFVPPDYLKLPILQ
jgi:putative protease